MIKPIIIGLLLLISALVMVSSIDVGDESDCPDGYGILTDGGVWECSLITSSISSATTIGGNNTLMIANECGEDTCNTFLQVNYYE